MCNLHWYYTFCTGVTLFFIVIHLNCIALSQSEWSNFFMYNYNLLLLLVYVMAIFILEDPLSVWMNLGKHLLFAGLYVSRQEQDTLYIWMSYHLMCNLNNAQ